LVPCCCSAIIAFSSIDATEAIVVNIEDMEGTEYCSSLKMLLQHWFSVEVAAFVD